MVSIDIAGETCLAAGDMPAWARVDDVPPRIRLWAGIDDADIATLFVAIARQNQYEGYSNFSEISRLITCDDTPILSCGLRVVEGDATIVTGCCCGVEDWREQVQAIVTGGGWLGHDPAPCAEVDGDDVKVWSDGGRDSAKGAKTNAFYLRVPRSTIAGIETIIERDLKAFLHVVRRWGTSAMGQAVAHDLVRKLDITWHVSSAVEI